MAENITPDDELGALEDALAQARAELGAMADAASAADQLADNSQDAYSLHEVAGIGRYAVVRHTGWIPLLNVIHNRAANIDFSANMYPGFDAIIGEKFPSPYLLDPLHEKYESYTCLRDNIAAVRNFLMETYYVNTPKGMTPEKAKQSLEEIAEFIGNGLDNNYRFLGLIPNHDPTKPYISISEASASGGAGAQYIYEKILEMQRHSNWMRPFAAVASLFGGKAAPHWMLPSAHETEFTDVLGTDILENDPTQPYAPTSTELEAGIDRVNALEARRAQLIDQRTLSASAQDLDALGNSLLLSASTMQDVTALSEPVRRDAIEIAKDILRKLKVSLGNVNILDGLKLPPNDDMEAFGAMKGVAVIYQRMLAYARSVNAGIMQDPSILAATRAIGQIGYLAKLEGLRMARIAGNGRLAQSLSADLARVPDVYATASGKTFGSLLDTVERGMDTILNRSQSVSLGGGHISHAPGKELGSINTAPTAGLSQQLALAAQTKTAQQNNQLLAAANAAQQSQTIRIQQQVTPPRQENTQGQQQAAPAQARGTSIRPMRQTSTRPAPASVQKPTSSTPPVPQTGAQNQNTIQFQNHHHEEEEARDRQLKLQQQQEQQRIAAVKKAAAAKAAAAKIDPNLLKGFQNATNTKGMTGPAVNPDPNAKNMYGQRIKPATQKPTPSQPTTKPPEGIPGTQTVDEFNRPVAPTSNMPRGGGRGF